MNGQCPNEGKCLFVHIKAQTALPGLNETLTNDKHTVDEKEKVVCSKAVCCKQAATELASRMSLIGVASLTTSGNQTFAIRQRPKPAEQLDPGARQLRCRSPRARPKAACGLGSRNDFVVDSDTSSCVRPLADKDLESLTNAILENLGHVDDSLSADISLTGLIRSGIHRNLS